MIDELERARREAQIGMGVALDHADAVAPGWSDDAYDFLVRFAEQHPTFISEDVSAASKDDPGFEQPPTDRAWGSVYRRASKNHVIEKIGIGVSRRRHASVCLRWRSRIYAGGDSVAPSCYDM